MKRLRSKLTYANVISTLCLVLLIGGGTAYAAAEVLPKNSVGTKQLSKGAVTPAKLSKASKATLTGPPGAKGETGATGAAGPKGLDGGRGPEGREGPAGKASDLFHASAFQFVSVAHAGTELDSITFTPTASGEVLVQGRGYCNLPTSTTSSEENDFFIGDGTLEQARFGSPVSHWGVIRVPKASILGGFGLNWNSQETVTVQAGVPTTVRVFGVAEDNSPLCSGTLTVLGLF